MTNPNTNGKVGNSISTQDDKYPEGFNTEDLIALSKYYDMLYEKLDEYGDK